MELDTSDAEACNRYRIAYGEAARLIEVVRMSLARGRDHAAKVTPERDAILTELGRRLSHIPAELVALAVDDALRARRPRW